jgi:hypothetical protein
LFAALKKLREQARQLEWDQERKALQSRIQAASTSGGGASDKQDKHNNHKHKSDKVELHAHGLDVVVALAPSLGCC